MLTHYCIPLKISQPLRRNEFHPVTAGRSKPGREPGLNPRLPAGVSLLGRIEEATGWPACRPAGRWFVVGVTAPARATTSEPMNVARASRAIGPGRPLPHSSHGTAYGHCPNLDGKPSWEEDPWRHRHEFSRCRGMPVATIQLC